MWVTSSTELALTPTVIALGKFDGVHRGHQRVIEPILKLQEENNEKVEQQEQYDSSRLEKKPAIGGFPQKNILPKQVTDLREQSIEQGDFSARYSLSLPNINQVENTIPPAIASSTEYIYSTVVTFNPHPQEFFTGKTHTLLTPVDEKSQQMRSLGVEQLVLLPFDKELCALTPEEFVEKILVQQLQCRKISVGQDFRFGSNRSGTAKDLQSIAARYDIPVIIVPLQVCSEELSIHSSYERISSSLIRQHLERGEVEQANQLLGRPYNLVGPVIKGQQLGRTIGFPTANLHVPKQKFLPRLGVYAVRVKNLGEASDVTAADYLGVMNIGCRPTVNGTYTSVEVHLLDWTGDLYCKKLIVQLEKFLRPEQKFPSLEALKTQIYQDCNAARAFFGG
ncbi:bifunctional riboflavin kinase/FAD synthetase [Aetokthonos hydrillicola Thurmond2011]|uniref:Bifunctional riboflavin kinase/FMN adenylyltransferase n=1 Tax=Aetokthonos hydrillicola Thurmond2011 TaxID=2712845 RepID=A0AAP5I4J2_9CYAN|nr:bifunctional riboflavin kinase/FAD synthetase [Aetokthonos hydrillicola]MBO3460897.1 bifunctional riboflavin kinase/FAD synthetase [Aetokthonos hydrillicola CCALA 1050]MBW4586447.1 bifunctional riboflavin kinase/FAD synthetase [Aetokthonos hydrillicola CCALA 1050]MDR9893607.1 bifunctional riboflavin kinase/FAD synthetase [Aetokthonos hydrillicola Thurmond2011]